MTVMDNRPISDGPDIPLAARALGWAGVLPFVGGAVALWQRGAAAEAALLPLLIYGAVILSFLGGVRWGLAMRAHGSERSKLLALSILPAFIAWIAACLYREPAAALVVLMFAHAMLAAADMGLARAGKAPFWYGRLRIELAAAAIISMGLALTARI